MAVDGAGAKLVPSAPPTIREVVSHPNVILWPAALASMLAALPSFARSSGQFGGMNDFTQRKAARLKGGRLLEKISIRRMGRGGAKPRSGVSCSRTCHHSRTEAYELINEYGRYCHIWQE